jgi:O-antigen/teichoic acid export membrane protein
MFITFFVMMGMAAMARPLILTLIGEKWLPSVPYLQLLCLSAMMFPLHALNLNILNVKGRSDLFLKLEVIKKALAVPVILAGVFLGITAMLIGMIILSFVAYFINSYYSGRFVSYPVREQIADILPSFILALAVSTVVFSLTFIPGIHATVLLLVQLTLLLILTVLLGKALRLEGYIEIRSIIVEKVPKLKGIL